MADWNAEWRAEVAAAQQRTSYEITGRLLARIRYGQEAGDWGAADGETCHDCGVAPGQYHRLRCRALSGLRRTGSQLSMLISS
jgi:hypothetical protein